MCDGLDSGAVELLHETEADRAIQRIDYDFGRTRINATTAAGVALRAKQLDDWTAEFLAEHQDATVLHLACGLDTRVHRLAPVSSVRWTGRFPSGQLLFDCYGTLGIRLQKLVPAVRNAGATLHRGIDDPHEIEGRHDGMECLDALRSVDMPGLDKFPATGQWGMWVLAHLPGLRDIGRIMRYRFWQRPRAEGPAGGAGTAPGKAIPCRS